MKKKEEQLKEKEEQMSKEKKPGKIPWPSSNSKPGAVTEPFNAKRSSVNIESKRKESKRLLSNFKVENTDKSFWNCAYPIIEYPE